MKPGFDFSQTLRFLGSGAVSVSLYYIILILLTEVGRVWYLTSAVVAFSVAYATNFLLHKLWTFRNREKESARRQLVLHLTARLLNMALNVLFLYLLVEHLRLNYLVAQAFITFALSVQSFFITRWIFRPTVRH